MEAPVHKTVFIAPKKKKKRLVTGAHGKQLKSGSASNASIVRRIHSYDVVSTTRFTDGHVINSPSAGRSQSSSTLDHHQLLSLTNLERFSLETDGLDDSTIASSPLVDERRPASLKDTCTTCISRNTVRGCDESTGLTHDGHNVDHDAIVVDASAPAVAGETLVKDTEKLNDNYLTLTGTIRRGKKDGHSIDVTLNMSRDELEKMEAELSRNAEPTSRSGRHLFSVHSGIHVFAFSLLIMPLVMIVSTCYAFYWGTFTWYNVYLHFSEERNLWHRVLVCPLLVITYPFQIPPISLGVGVYAALAQISWRYDRWHAEVQDLEKGFFGWACAALHLVDCAPYQVVVLNDIPFDSEKVNIKPKDIDTTTV